MGMYHLAGRVALVTGAARGIGYAIAERLAREDCQVILNDIRADALDEACQRLAQAGRTASSVAADIAERADVERVFGLVEERFGGLDILVNNAGIVPKRRWVAAQDDADFDQVIRVNVKSVFLCSRQAAVSMARRGGGAIVNVSSVGAARSFRGMVSYVTSKGAVESQTRALALDLAPYAIRVNAVGPGMTRTPAWDTLGPEAIERRSRVPPLGRPATPTDIANTVAFLVSSEAAYITGQVLYVDGGILAQCYSPYVEVPDLIEPPPPDFDLGSRGK